MLILHVQKQGKRNRFNRKSTKVNGKALVKSVLTFRQVKFLKCS